MILDFIIENYYYFIIGGMAIIEFIVFLLRKRPILNLEDHIKSVIDDCLPYYVNLAEKSGATGVEKLAFVVDHILRKIKGQVSHQDVTFWKDFIISKVEGILSTPQKKG